MDEKFTQSAACAGDCASCGSDCGIDGNQPTVTLTLENDGTNWKLKSDDVFVEAILGNIKEAVANTSTSPET